MLAWEVSLPSGSLLVVSAEANNKALHCVPLIGKKDKQTKDGITISKERVPDISPYGQDADCKERPPPFGCVYIPKWCDDPSDLLSWAKAQNLEEVVLMCTMALK